MNLEKSLHRVGVLPLKSGLNNAPLARFYDAFVARKKLIFIGPSGRRIIIARLYFLMGSQRKVVAANDRYDHDNICIIAIF